MKIQPTEEDRMYALARRKRLRGWLGGLLRGERYRRWRWSTAYSIIKWVVNFVIVLVAVSIMGNGWVLNLAVSVVLDVVLYRVNKIGPWGDREVVYVNSVLYAIAVWIGFFFFNAATSYLLIQRADMPVWEAKSILIPLGIVLNPVIYLINNKWVYHAKTSTEAA